jgi:hypothetical protein
VPVLHATHARNSQGDLSLKQSNYHTILVHTAADVYRGAQQSIPRHLGWLTPLLQCKILHPHGKATISPPYFAFAAAFFALAAM